MNYRKIEDYLMDDKTKNFTFGELILSSCPFQNIIITNDIEFDFSGKEIFFKYNNITYCSSQDDLFRFITCKFENHVKINTANLTKDIEFVDNTFYKNLIIKFNDKDDNSNIKFEILECSINNLIVSNSSITRSFLIHETKITNFNFTEVDCFKLVEFYKVTFGVLNSEVENNNFFINGVVFKDLALFDECIFNSFVFFKYTIFESFTYFRDSIFYSGLNLDYSSHKQAINFHGVIGLNSKNSKNKTTQETYRIIKHNFEVLGNKIESNLYHSLELKKKHENVKWYSLDNIVLCLHKVSSNYSTNWFYAFCWILVIGILTNFSLGKFVENFQFEWINVFKYINITHYGDCLKENPFILFLNKISLGYLYYQFLMSVRKDTRK